MGKKFKKYILHIKYGKNGHNENVKLKYTKYEVCDCFLPHTNFKDDLIEYRCLCCNKNYQQKFDEKLKEQFLLRKSVYPYECMDDWEKYNETSLPEKEDFYSHLNMEDTTDADYAHAKRVCKDFETKNLGEDHDL